MASETKSTGRTVRAAVVQAASVAFDREATLDKVAHWTAEAATTGAELVVFPEAFVSGYPKGSNFGAVVGSRSAEGRDWYRRYYDSSVDVPGPAVDRLKNSPISEVVVTGTLPVPDELRFDKLTVLTIAPLLARAISEVFEDGSVTSLFDGAS